MRIWPFSSKKEESKAEEKKDEPDFDQKLIRELSEWRKIGETFEYIGRTLVVTGHSRIDIIPNIHFPSFRIRAAIVADYADDLGVIREIVFDAQKAITLMRSQPREDMK